MRNLIAQIPIYPENGFTGEGPFGLEDGYSEAGLLFNRFVSSTVGLLTIVAGIWFIFVFITGAISVIGSGGDKVKVEAARNRILHGIIGLAVTVAAIFTIELIGRILGLDLILNPAEFVENIWS
jgi:hypothetical protein